MRSILKSLSTSVAMLVLATQVNAAEIKIGFVGPLSGPVAVYGSDPLNASRIAVEQINASGILGEDTLTLIPADSTANPAHAAQAARRMVMSDNVIAIIGGHTSAETQAIVEATRTLQLPVLSTLAQTNALTTGDNQWFVRICQNTDIWGKSVANWLKQDVAPQKVFMMGRNDSYGQSLQTSIKANLEEQGVAVIAAESYDPNARDFKPILAKAKEMGADFLVISGFYTDTGLVVKQMAELGLDVPYFNNTAVAIPEFSDIAGAAAKGAYGATYYMPGSIDSETETNFLSFWQGKFNRAPTQYEGMGYDGVYLMADAIVRAKASGELTRESLRDALFATKDFSGVTGTISITETGDVIRPLPIVQIGEAGLELKALVH